MGDKDKLLLLALLLLAFGGGLRGGPVPGRRRQGPRGPVLDPGWYWYWYAPDVDARVNRWRARNRSKLSIRKTFGGPSLGATVIVFEVLEEIPWTLPGLPESAPRGINTDLSDVAWAIPSPPSALRKMAEQAAQATWEYLRQLYEGTRPPRQPFPAP